MQAVDSHMDSQGISQHHDGVSGTAKQHVADDYNWRIFSSIEFNNPIYASALNEWLELNSNIRNAKWQWCQQLNGTYLDCPVSQITDDSQMLVMIHNPSPIDQQNFRLQLPKATVVVSVWDLDQ